MNNMDNKKRISYIIATIILFAVEVCIELFYKDGFIRENFGDVLVVILLYTFVRIFVPKKTPFLPVVLFVFAVFVEYLQKINILETLGLAQYKLIRIIAGSQFDYRDIICYAVGALACQLIEIADKLVRLIQRFKPSTIFIIFLLPGAVIALPGSVFGEGLACFFPSAILINILCVFPIFFTLSQIYCLYTKKENSVKKMMWDYAGILFGGCCEVVYLGFLQSVNFDASWDQQLYNRDIHSPIYPDTYILVALFIILFLIGRKILVSDSYRSKPPLVVVLGISFMYLGAAFSIIFTIQISDLITEIFDCCLLLLPTCIVLITAHTIMMNIIDYRKDENRSSKIDNVPILSICNNLLENAKLWPVIALILLLPILGIVTIILVLFGQAPDTIIKMWTETSDFKLSQQIAPQNLYYDEHYLCTVAAGGHREVVKPLRRGVRHGHEVTVNRQLCIANAFEQILEIHTPKFHRRLRNFYDTYGFPVARLIKSRWIADMIWFIMKPLEWIFIIVLYMTEVHPEDRIALQYTGKDLKDFSL